jgi:polyhydroxyalkanoate synthesis regulator phasin
MSEKATKTAKAKVSQVLNQAKDSLKLLETLEKEALAKARSFVKLPNPDDRILAGLRKLGVATQAEVEELKVRVEELEARLGKTPNA